MNIWSNNRSEIWQQITHDKENGRFVWHPSELQDNIFELIGRASNALDVEMKEEPYEIRDDTWAWDYEE